MVNSCCLDRRDCRGLLERHAQAVIDSHTDVFPAQKPSASLDSLDSACAACPVRPLSLAGLALRAKMSDLLHHELQ